MTDQKVLFNNYEFGVRGQLLGTKSIRDIGNNFHIIALYDGKNKEFNKDLGISDHDAEGKLETGKILGGSSNDFSSGTSFGDITAIPFLLCEGIDAESNRVLYFSTDIEDMFETNTGSHKNGGLATMLYDDKDDQMSLTFKSKISNATISHNGDNKINSLHSVKKNNLNNVKNNQTPDKINKFNNVEYSLNKKYVYAGVPYDLPTEINWVFKKTTKIAFNDGYRHGSSLTISDIDISANISSKQKDYIKYLFNFDDDDSFFNYASTITNSSYTSFSGTSGPDDEAYKHMLEDTGGILYKSIYDFYGGVSVNNSANSYIISQEGTCFEGVSSNDVCKINTTPAKLTDQINTSLTFIPSYKRFYTLSSENGTSFLYNKNNTNFLNSTDSYVSFNNGNTNSFTSFNMSDIPINGFIGIQTTDDIKYNYYYNKEKHDNKIYLNVNFDKYIGNNDISGESFDIGVTSTIKHMFIFTPPKSSDFIKPDSNNLKDNIKFYLIPAADVSYLANHTEHKKLDLIPFRSNYFKNGFFHSIIESDKSKINTNHYYSIIQNSLLFILMRRRGCLSSGDGYWASHNDNSTPGFSDGFNEKNSLNNYSHSNTDNGLLLDSDSNPERNNIPIIFTDFIEAEAGILYNYCKADQRCGENNCMGTVSKFYLDDKMLKNANDFGIDIDECKINHVNPKSVSKNVSAIKSDVTEDHQLTEPAPKHNKKSKPETALILSVTLTVIVIVGIFIFYFFIKDSSSNITLFPQPPPQYISQLPQPQYISQPPFQ